MPAITSIITPIAIIAMTEPWAAEDMTCDSMPTCVEPTEGLERPSTEPAPDAQPQERPEGQRKVELVLRPNTYEALCAAAGLHGCSLSQVVEPLLRTHLLGDQFDGP